MGSLAAIVFGIWLAVHVRDYSITDGWILDGDRAVGDRRGDRRAHLDRLPQPAGSARSRGRPGARCVVMHALLVLSVLLILLDMIYKPGAG